MMKILLLVMGIIIGQCENEKSFNAKNTFISFKNYTLHCKCYDLVKKRPEELRDLFAFIYILNGIVEMQSLFFLIKYKDVVLYQYELLHKEKLEKLIDKKILEYSKEILVENVNYDGFLVFKTIYEDFLKNNFYLVYNICVLDDIDVAEVKQNLSTITMKDLLKNYCIFRFFYVEEDRGILNSCPTCTKKDIRTFITCLAVGEKALFYISRLKRHVVIERHPNQPIKDSFSNSDLKMFYILYGLSIIYNNFPSSFEKKVHKVLHELICSMN
jgi:hypothetical protein